MRRTPTAAVPEATVDLRTQPCQDVIDRVERCLGVRLDPETAVVKRRSVGGRTDRDTWVRIEARPFSKVTGQGSGVEGAACLPRTVAKPEWYQGLSWQIPEQRLLWRADETELVTASPIKPGGVLITDPGLADAWWATLGRSLEALATQSITRIATPHTVPISQERVTATIEGVFPGCVETTEPIWAAGPDWCPSCSSAPRSSLPVTTYAGPLAEPSRREAARLISSLQS
jgi:hypothetical protein